MSENKIDQIETKDDLINYIKGYIEERGQRSFHVASRNSKKLKDLIDRFSEQNTDDLTHSAKSELLIKGITRPLCVVCGKRTAFNRNTREFLKTCSYTCLAKNPEYRRNHSDAILKKYGSSNFWASEQHKKNLEKSNMSKYGVSHYFKSDEFKAKTRATNREKYGTDWACQHPEARRKASMKRKSLDHTKIQEKCRSTWIKNHGVDHPFKSLEIFEKQQKSSYYFRDYTMPSGSIVRVQGYEDKALDLLISQYEESDLIVSNREIMKRTGVIEYIENGKTRRYYPDVLIESTRTIIEVKSTRTFAVQRNKNLLKREATMKLGFNFQFWIFDEKGLVEIL